MFHVLCSTNRPGANSLVVSRYCLEALSEKFPSESFELIDLAALREDILSADCFEKKPDWFLEEFQNKVSSSEGLLVVIPEYNGSFPGVLKVFVDNLSFPDSLSGLPCAFVGIAAGQFGALRAVEQMTAIFQYRLANVFGERLFVPKVHEHIQDGGFQPGAHAEMLDSLLRGFVEFSKACRS